MPWEMGPQNICEQLNHFTLHIQAYSAFPGDLHYNVDGNMGN